MTKKEISRSNDFNVQIFKESIYIKNSVYFGLFFIYADEHSKAVHDDWQPFIPKEPSPILHAFYDVNEEEYFWLSMVCWTFVSFVPCLLLKFSYYSSSTVNCFHLLLKNFCYFSVWFHEHDRLFAHL